MPSAIELSTLGHRIRHHRLEMGLTLDELGAKVGVAGSQLSLIENGKREPKLSLLQAIAQATEQELASLADRGVRIAGNACSPIVLVKGDLDEAECSGGELAAGADGAALRKALGAIGYAPEDFCVLASVAGVGDGAVAVGETLPCELFREALEALDPEAVLLLDNNAADVMRETYADMLVAIDDFDTAMLKPGLVAHVQGRRVLALDGFEAALTDKAAKQRMWAYIKQLTPAVAPL